MMNKNIENIIINFLIKKISNNEQSEFKNLINVFSEKFPEYKDKLIEFKDKITNSNIPLNYTNVYNIWNQINNKPNISETKEKNINTSINQYIDMLENSGLLNMFKNLKTSEVIKNKYLTIDDLKMSAVDGIKIDNDKIYFNVIGFSKNDIDVDETDNILTIATGVNIFNNKYLYVLDITGYMITDVLLHNGVLVVSYNEKTSKITIHD